MAWRFNGRAHVNPSDPDAFAICDRCGFRYNLSDLKFQFDWRGNRLMNLYERVCPRCYDEPFEHYRPIVVPPDPLPRHMPRPDIYAPNMPLMLTDTLGQDLTDTNGGYLTAVEPAIPGPTASTATSLWAADDYAIAAPGGVVVLIPE